MSLRRGIVTALGVLVTVACASTEQISEDMPGLDGTGATASSGTGGASTGGDSSGGETSGNDVSSGGAATSGGATGSGAVSSGGSGAGGKTSSSGGVPSSVTGGTTGSGGKTSASGGKGSGGVPDADASAPCPSGEKLCPGDSQCKVFSPGIGCGESDTCLPCPAAPANGFPKCTASACDFDCYSGFHRNAAGDGCDSGNGAGGTIGSGGAISGGRTGRGGRSSGGRTGTGGTTGTGGSSSCSARNCPSCSNLLQAPCCHNDGTCGCGLLGLLCGN